MFGLFKSDPVKKLQKQYERLSEQAMGAQRSGNMERFAQLTSQAEAVGKELDALRASSG